MKLHIFEADCATKGHNVIDFVCGAAIILAAFVIIHYAFIYAIDLAFTLNR